MLHVSTHLRQVHYGLQTQNGLLDEVSELSRLQGSTYTANLDTMSPSPLDFTHGVFQSIGKFEWITSVERSFDLRQASEHFINISLTHHGLK